MFACRVAAGDWCYGRNGQLTPDVKSGNDLFDCTVDNINDPSIVVVYHDAQAYPECECTIATLAALAIVPVEEIRLATSAADDSLVPDCRRHDPLHPALRCSLSDELMPSPWCSNAEPPFNGVYDSQHKPCLQGTSYTPLRVLRGLRVSRVP